jgi:hypothetical protein
MLEEEALTLKPSPFPKMGWNGFFKGNNQAPFVQGVGMGRTCVGYILVFLETLVGVPFQSFINVEYCTRDFHHVVICELPTLEYGGTPSWDFYLLFVIPWGDDELGQFLE